MDNLRTGEKIAGAFGVALLIIMFLAWWGTPDTIEVEGLGEVSTEGFGGDANAWEAADFLDLIWALTALVAIGLAITAATASQVNLPVALSAITAGLGILSVVTILFRLIDTPYDLDRKYGVFLGLIAAAGIAYGGWRAMEEEGTSFGEQADRIGGDAPPPPPPAAPPSSGGPAA
jgi:hypothetical protein